MENKLGNVRILQLWRVGWVIFNFSRKSYVLTKNCFGYTTIQRVCVSFEDTTRVSFLGI